MLIIDIEKSLPSQSEYRSVFDLTPFKIGTKTTTDNRQALTEIIFGVPDAFFEALADFEAGRIVDLDTALNAPPDNA